MMACPNFNLSCLRTFQPDEQEFAFEVDLILWDDYEYGSRVGCYQDALMAKKISNAFLLLQNTPQAHETFPVKPEEFLPEALFRMRDDW